MGHCGFRFRRHPVVQLLTVSDAIELVAERSERAGDFSFDPRSKVAGRLRHGPALAVHKIVGVGLDRDLEGRNEASGERRHGFVALSSLQRSDHSRQRSEKQAFHLGPERGRCSREEGGRHVRRGQVRPEQRGRSSPFDGVKFDVNAVMSICQPRVLKPSARAPRSMTSRLLFPGECTISARPVFPSRENGKTVIGSPVNGG